MGTVGAVASHFATDTAGKWFGGFANLMINGRLNGARQMAFAIGSVEIPGGEEAELALDGINAARETMDVSRVAESAEAVEASGGITVSDKGLNLVEQHLAQFGDDPANAAMLDRLRLALRDGQAVSGADANFYLHEASEATMMKNGLDYASAHSTALSKYGVSPFSLYHPEVIEAFPELFNNAWRLHAGLAPLP